MSHSCDLCINTHVTCAWRQACLECTQRHDQCLIDRESVTQCVPHRSRPKKKKAQVVSQLIIEEVSEEVVVEQLCYEPIH